MKPAEKRSATRVRKGADEIRGCCSGGPFGLLSYVRNGRPGFISRYRSAPEKYSMPTDHDVYLPPLPPSYFRPRRQKPRNTMEGKKVLLPGLGWIVDG